MIHEGETGYQICKRCVMDTTDPDIYFDDQGVCNHCNSYIQKEKSILRIGKEDELSRIVVNIKKHGKNKDYDCVLGISGGVDSSYAALVAHQLGLKVLLVHFDNGWNSELAVSNVEQVSRKLDFDLYTHVVDWEEFRDLQLAYIKASVVDIEVPTDHGIKATVYNVANKHKIKSILGGNDWVTEGVTVLHWGWDKDDLHNLKSIHKKFGNVKLKTFPTAGYGRLLYQDKIKRKNSFFPLNYVKYDRREAKETLIQDLK